MDRNIGNEIWVGNIPFKTSEEDIKNLFSQVGQVVNFNIVVDPATGKSNGYGFCKFKDSQTASQAIKRFNDYEFNSRSLKVSLPDSGQKDQRQMRTLASQTPTRPEIKRKAPTKALPGSSEQKINNALDNMSTEQITEILLAVKAKIEQNPEEAHQMIGSNPALAYALLQAQVILDLLPENETEQFTKNPKTSPETSPPMPPPPPNVPPMVHMMPGYLPPHSPSMVPPYNAPMPPFHSATMYGDYTHQHGMYPEHIPPHFHQQQQEYDKRIMATFETVLRMTPAQLESLSPEERSKVESIRETFYMLQRQQQLQHMHGPPPP